MLIAFVGTNCVILGGIVLPDHSVLGAMSLLNKVHSESWGLYAGQPSQLVKSIDPSFAYFNRQTGFVN